MGTNIDITSGTSRPLAVFDKPLNRITTALAIGNKLRQKRFTSWGLNHHAGSVSTAIAARKEQFAHFVEADSARLLLYRALREKLERPVAADMITALYTAVGVKAGEESAGMLAGSVDMIESDGIGQASGLWQPLHVSPAILALACRKLITTSVFPPKPAELRAACEAAGNNLHFAYNAAATVVEQVRKADAILLAFDYDEWKRAYESPQYRPALALMLEWHEQLGDGSLEFDYDDYEHPFKMLIMREQAKLAIEQAPAPKRIAAARRRPQQKRGPKPKSESEAKEQ